MRALSARILNICSVVTRVHRPCLMTWQTLVEGEGGRGERKEWCGDCWVCYCSYCMWCLSGRRNGGWEEREDRGGRKNGGCEEEREEEMIDCVCYCCIATHCTWCWSVVMWRGRRWRHLPVEPAVDPLMPRQASSLSLGAFARERGREEGREGGWERGREGGREEGREGGREGGKEVITCTMTT